MYKLTVAVITFNRAKYLTEMLDSILRQTYSQFYVKIYDNCSTDNTAEVVMPYLRDERFSYFRHSSVVENGNFAFQDCKTDYLLIAHDDDIMLPNMVKEEVSILDRFDDVSMVVTNTNMIDQDGKPMGYSVLSFWIPNGCFINSREYIDIFLDRGNAISCPTAMFRMEIIRRHNFSFRVAEIGGASDAYLWFELNQLEHRFYFVPTPLYNYRIHAGQDSANSPFLTSRLRKPVYQLLSKNGYSGRTKGKWLKYINGLLIMETCNRGYGAFLEIEDTLLVHNCYDWTLYLGIVYGLYVCPLIKKTKKSKFYQYAKKVKKLLCKWRQWLSC